MGTNKNDHTTQYSISALMLKAEKQWLPLLGRVYEAFASWSVVPNVLRYQNYLQRWPVVNSLLQPVSIILKKALLQKRSTIQPAQAKWPRSPTTNDQREPMRKKMAVTSNFPSASLSLTQRIYSEEMQSLHQSKNCPATFEFQSSDESGHNGKKEKEGIFWMQFQLRLGPIEWKEGFGKGFSVEEGHGIS